MKKFLLFLVFVWLSILTESKIHECKHNNILQYKSHSNVFYKNHPYQLKNQNNQKSDLKDDKEKRRLASSSYQPIRILPDYTSLDSTDIDSSLKEYAKQLVSACIRFFGQMLQVIPISPALYVNRPCQSWFLSNHHCVNYTTCGVVQIPDAHAAQDYLYDERDELIGILPNGDGISNGDLIIYVSSDPENCDENTLAWATACSQDQYGRPVAGTINFCSQSLSTREWKQDVITTLHELTHVLIMDPDIWDDFINPETGITLSTDEIIYQTTSVPSNNDNRVTYLITPKVTSLMKEHYNCDSLIGIPLEDDGSAGSVGSHWEEHYLKSEYMNAVIYTPLQYVSKFTFGLMEDSGWYKVDYNYQDLYYFGLNASCSFWEDSCIDETTHESNFPQYYCTSPYDNGCTLDYSATSYCYIYNYTSVPSKFQYFENKKLAGSDYSEYCPFRDATLDYGDYYHVCWDSEGNNSPYKNVIESFDINSRCISTYNNNIRVGYCLNMKCNNTTSLIINISNYNETIECLNTDYGKNKTLISLESFNIICPDVNLLCNDNSSLSKCYYGKYDNNLDQCICSPGYNGTTCIIEDDNIIIKNIELYDGTYNWTSHTPSPNIITTYSSSSNNYYSIHYIFIYTIIITISISFIF